MGKYFCPYNLIFLSIYVLAIFLFVSFSATALHHILLLIPGFYFLYKAIKEKEFKLSKSAGFLLVVIFIAILSIIFNDVEKPLRIALKLKYFLFGILLIFAASYWLKSKATEGKLKGLIYTFLIFTTIATISGLVAKYTGFNYLKMKPACHAVRTCGMYGMYMTYAYGLQFFLLINLALIIYRKKNPIKLNLPFLMAIFAINLIGFYLSYARGAYLGFILAIPFLFVRCNFKKFLISIMTIITVMTISFFMVPEIKELFLSNNRLASNAVRMSQYKTAWRAGVENPVLGLGYRNFEPQTRMLKEKWGIEYPNFQGHAHNNFLEHLASTGFFGFIALILFHLFWFIEALKRKDPLGDFSLAFIMCLFISGQVQYTLGDGENLFIIMFIYALTQIPKEYFLKFMINKS